MGADPRITSKILDTTFIDARDNIGSIIADVVALTHHGLFLRANNGGQ